MIPTQKKLSLKEALAVARETRCLEIGEGILDQGPRIFREQFGSQKAILVSDDITVNIAGRALYRAFQTGGIPMEEPFLFHSPKLDAKSPFVTELENILRKNDAIPVAIGS